MNNDWVWTDELVLEYVTAVMTTNHPYLYKLEDWKKFQQEKQQSKNNQDWEILSFKSSLGNICKLRDNGKYSYDRQGAEGIWSLEVMQNDLTNKIHSVKVLSSGEIFSVGDITNQGRITGFHFINNNTMFADFENNLRYCRLSELKKVKPILFTTEDGKPIYEGDKIYIPILNSSSIDVETVTKYSSSQESNKVFSTKDKAKEWLYLNKSINVSVQELMNRLHAYFKNPVEAFENLKHLSKQKINQ